MCGDFFQGIKAALIHLLLPAHIVQRDHFYGIGVLEIGHPRVVESQMAIFPDAQANDVYGIPGKQGAVAFAFGFDVRGFPPEIMHRAQGNLGEKMLPQEMPETLGRCGLQADVFVHVEGIDPCPVYSRRGP